MSTINVTLFHVISQEMIPNIDVLGAGMIFGILSNIEGNYHIEEAHVYR